jgi:sugar lactone lactonase YvrE
LLVLAYVALGLIGWLSPATIRAAEEPKAEATKELSAQEKAQKEAQAQMEAAMKAYQEQLKAEAEARAKDPAWKATHKQVRVIKPAADMKADAIHNFCLNLDGNLLVACGGDRMAYIVEDEKTGRFKTEKVSEPTEIRVVSPEGTLVKTWKLDFAPQALCVHKDGTIFVGGDGRLAKLSADGKVIASAESPAVAAAKTEPKPEEKKPVEEPKKEEPPKKSVSVVGALLKATGLASEGSGEATAAAEPAMNAEMAEMMARRKREFTGMAVTGQDLFFVTSMSKGYGYCVWRTDHDFQNGKVVVENLPGCCGQMDVQASKGELWIAENGRHRVGRYDRDGKQLATFGKRDRKAADGFGGCCEPKNLRFAANGDVLACESGPPVAVKRFSPDGKFLGVVGVPEFKTGCVRVTVEISKDGSQVFVLNTSDNAIHVLADVRNVPTHEQAAILKIPGDGPIDLHTFCVAADNNLLAACGGEREAFVQTKDGPELKTVGTPGEIKVLDPDGKLLTTWKPGVTPQAINVAPDGAVYVGGQGKLARLSKDGKVLKTADAPHIAELGPLPPLPEKKEAKPETTEEAAAKKAKLDALQAKMKEAMAAFQEAAKAMNAAKDDAKAREAANAKYQETMAAYVQAAQELQEARTTPELLAMQKRSAILSKSAVNAVAVTEKDVFVACPETKGYGFAVWRLDRDLTEPKKIVEGLRGCCGQMDIQTHGGDLYVAENARKRVVRYDRNGKELAAWGEAERQGVAGFGSCCNPMNIRFGASGELFTSESNLGRIKRFQPDGQFLGIAAEVSIVPGCKHVAIGISSDGKRMYLLDITRSHIVALKAREGTAVAAAP